MTENKSTLSDSTLPTTTEEWRDIPGYEGFYQVSDLGRVRTGAKSHRRGVKLPALGLMSQFFDKKGYAYVCFTLRGKRDRWLIHRLVMHVFVGKCPDGYEVNHKNGVKNDNRVENLEYVTPLENVRHSINVLGYTGRGESNANATLTEEKVREIRRLIGTGISQADIARSMGIGAMEVSRIKHKKRWQHLKD